MGILPALLFLVQAPFGGSIPPDSAKALRDFARKAEREYEYLLRSLAPTRHGGSYSRGDCDEIVGRFCLRYEGDDTRRPDPEVPGKVISARQLAVESLRRAFAALPGDLSTAGPLLRYLVEDGRAEEAVSAARAFTWASGDSVWGPLLEAYALHAVGDDSLAEARFDEGLAHLAEEDRRELERVSHLVAPKEKGTYEDLGAGERSAYEEALWRLADPLYLTPGNERRVEHLARHVWSRLLSDAPVVRRMSRWGEDLEQLTVRYGVPTSRERLLSWSIMTEESMVEYFDPEQLAYVPEALRTEGFPGAPAPGDDWPLDNPRARSGFAPRTIRRLLAIDHQTSRFPDGDSVVLRVDGTLALDSAAVGRTAARAGLFILDGRYRPIREIRSPAAIVRDTVALSYEVRLPTGDTYVYSLELIENETRLGGRARYAIDASAPAVSGLALSDPVVVHPYGTGDLPTRRTHLQMRPLTRLVFSPGDTIGLYAEAHRLRAGADGTTRYGVRLVLRPAEEPAFLARAFRWLGRTLGLAGPRSTPSLTWEGEGREGRPALLAVDLPLSDVKPGLYAIELTVQDRVGGASESTIRLVRIVEKE